MNRNSIIGFILIAGIMIFYTVYMTPSKEEVAEKQRVQDSIAQVQKAIHEAELKARTELEKEKEEARVQTTEDTPIESSEPIKSSDNYQSLKDKFAAFAGSANGIEETIEIETELVKYELSTKGGFLRNASLKDYQTYDTLPLRLFDPDRTNFGLTFFANNRLINTSQLYFRPSGAVPDVLSINGEEEYTISMLLYADAGEGQIDPNRYIEYLYTFKGNDYMFDLDIKIVNLKDVISVNTSSIDLFWHADVLRQEQTIDQFNGSTVYYRYIDEDVDYLSETDDDEEQIKTSLKWVSFKQRFFSSTLISREHFEGGTIKTYELDPHPFDRYLKSFEADLVAPYNFNGNTTIPLSIYMGPNKFNTLKSYAMGLERQIPIGWSFFLMAWINEFIVIPVFDWLGGYGWNYGIVILVLTILLKTVLFPIAYKTYMSSAKMRVLKPEVDEIGKKYPKKEDSMKKQQAVMALYKSAGANPASGCVPMLLQLPILIAMFRFFPSSIELRQESFLWAHDLSTYDSIMQLPFEIPFYGDHVSLFTLLMTVSTVMYTYLNNQMMGQQSTQLPGMKTMMYLMPIMFLGIFNNYASGLSYYYFLANIITFGQMFVFRKAINEDKLRAKIEANKKKPTKKKSGFQKRLEDAAKKRGYKS